MSFQRVLQSGPAEREIRRLWSEYERHPLRSWRHAWRLWRLWRKFDLTPPERERWTYRFAPGQVPDCARCDDVCCQGSTNTVLLRLVDVALFVDRGWTQHLTLHKPSFPESLLAERPRLRDMTRSFHWRLFPIIKQEDSGRCPFVDNEGCCTIHQDRPWACRAFPYRLDIEQKQVFWGSRCPSPRQAEPHSPLARELRHAVFHNFYTEKIRDLLLLRVYPEEIAHSAAAPFLALDSLRDG